MELKYTSEEVAFRDEVRRYFAEMLTPEVREDLDRGPESKRFRLLIRQMGRDGLLGLSWPKEFGGHGRSVTEQFILFDEVQRARAPFPFHGVNTVGPTLIRYGSPAQQAAFLPRIVAGELNFAVGYTEAEAGTDLASLTTRAVRDGEEYVINGAKLYTSGAFHADYIWLACRTDREAPKHKGISLILVPTDAKGYSWSRIDTVGDHATCSTYYDDVRVPRENLVGEENAGWRLMTNQLNHERVAMAARGGAVEQALDDTISLTRTTIDVATGRPLIEVPWVQQDLARCRALVAAMRLLNWKTAAAAADGTLSAEVSSASKVYGSEAAIEVFRLLVGILGVRGPLRPGAPGAASQGRIEAGSRDAQLSTFTGGINEVQREIIATAGLGMPRVPR